MADQDRIRDLERQLNEANRREDEANRRADETNRRADEANMSAARMEQQNNDLIRILVRAAIERNNILITFQWMADTLNAAIDILWGRLQVLQATHAPPAIGGAPQVIGGAPNGRLAIDHANAAANQAIGEIAPDQIRPALENIYECYRR